MIKLNSYQKLGEEFVTGAEHLTMQQNMIFPRQSVTICDTEAKMPTIRKTMKTIKMRAHKKKKKICNNTSHFPDKKIAKPTICNNT